MNMTDRQTDGQTDRQTDRACYRKIFQRLRIKISEKITYSSELSWSISSLSANRRSTAHEAVWTQATQQQ